MVTIPPGSSLGRYRIIEQLGRGGMATVFRCHDPNLDRFVAVKVLPSYHTEDPTFVGRFAQEAQTIARLNHPNILQIYDFGDDKGYTYIVSELVRGGDLQDRLTGEAMSVEDVLEYITPLADALDYAHGEGILHRDLKPANVLINEAGQPILADFGLARMLESSTRFTQAQQAIGTPEYMAPEQAMGAESDHRADLYSVGIMLYQMLLGQTPFQADTPAATLMAHIHRPLPLPTLIKPDLDTRVEMTLLKALAKEPIDRFQTATEMIEALEAVAGISGAASRVARPAPRVATPSAAAGARAVGTAPEPMQSGQRSGIPKWLLGGGVAVIVAVVAVFAFLWFQGGDEEGQPVAQAASGPDLAALSGASAAGVGSPGSVDSGGSSQQETPTTNVPQPAAGVPVATEQPTPAVIQTEATSNGADSNDPCAAPSGSPGAGAGSMAAAIAQLEDMQDRVHLEVAALRQIYDPPPVDTRLRTRQDLCQIVSGVFRRPEVRQQLFEAEELYKTLGLIPEDRSLEQMLLAIQLHQHSAYFDGLSGYVYVVSDATEITPDVELGYAMAFMGGLQQELFDVTGLSATAWADTGDGLRATNALISGDVAVVRIGYDETVIPKNYDLPAETPEPNGDNPLANVPAIVRKNTLFPAIEGKQFVVSLFELGQGWQAVNDAYGNPPVSTEQVLHPEKYFIQEAPLEVTVPDFSGLMSPGWSLTATDTLGEFVLRSYLEEHVSPSEAATAAAGWGGDQYLLLGHPELGRLALAQVVFDSVEDASEFHQTFRDFMTAATAGTNTQTDPGDNLWRWSTRGGKTVVLVQEPQAAILVVADDAVAITDAMESFGEAMSNLQSTG